jgi:thymidylate synthase (FAD)
MNILYKNKLLFNISDNFGAQIESNQINEVSYKIKKTLNNEIDNILGEKFDILDHGFIRVIDYMGDDSSVVQAARVSYGSGTKKVNEDIALIRYLMRHMHTTPFEMCEIKFHIKAPFFVARQWLRHRTANVNEYSARYSIIEDDFYLPDDKNIGYQSLVNKQCREDIDIIDDNEILKIKSEVQKLISSSSKSQYDVYKSMLDKNIAREISRMSLTLNYYTEFYWKIDVHNLMHFIKLRADEHAQYEIRVYAQKMLEILKLWMPITYDAFLDYRKNSYLLSAQMIEFIKLKLKNISNIKIENLSKREIREIYKIFDIEEDSLE